MTTTTQLQSSLGEHAGGNVPGRLGARSRNHIAAWIGLPWQRRLAQAALEIAPIRSRQIEWSNASDADLQSLARQLRSRARGGESLDRLAPEAFALVDIAVRRSLGLAAFDVQLAAGIVLHRGGLVELATGEGKTLVAAFPAFLNALPANGVHVVTVNEYLARRDADWLRPVFHKLGMSVGVAHAQMADPERAAAYRCDITYGVASSFGFDYLRDRLKVQQKIGATPFWAPWTSACASSLSATPEMVQRGHHFALVDEADNIFIDEARTPLVISVAGKPASADEAGPYLWANRVAQEMREGVHFILEEKKREFTVTEKGLAVMRWSSPPHAEDLEALYDRLDKALHAHYRLRKNHDYMIVKDKIVIVDEFTGRTMPDRSWGQGLHQAVEAKEGVQIHVANDHAAQVTFQSYFRLYAKRAGMTGTASPNWWEIWRVYGLWVVPVPTNRPMRRRQLPDRVFPTEDAKFAAVVEEVRRLVAVGRPILIGTRSVEKSQKLSALLQEAEISHQVLNAQFHEEEAAVIARAGQRGQVTIATNMAGRGTDIKLGPGVAELGGLHVLGTERHEAARIDRQLMGRAGRQGDLGSGQFFLCLEDDLLEGLGPFWQEQIRKVGRGSKQYDWQKFLRFFREAQRKWEKRHYRERVDLLAYEKQRGELLDDLAADPFVD